MDAPFFIMVRTPDGNGAQPIVDDDEYTMFYESEDDAREAMKGHVYAEVFGFRIFNWDDLA